MREAQSRERWTNAPHLRHIRDTASGIETRANLDMGNNGAIIPVTIAREIIKGKGLYDICPILEKSRKFNAVGALDVPCL